MLPHMDLWEARNGQNKKISTAGRQTRTLFPDDPRKQKTGRKGAPEQPSPDHLPSLKKNGETALKYRISRPRGRRAAHMGGTVIVGRDSLSMFLAIGVVSGNVSC